MLPLEIYYYLFDFLSLSQILKFNLNKKLYGIINQNYFWKKRFIRDFGSEPITNNFISYYKSEYKKIIKLFKTNIQANLTYLIINQYIQIIRDNIQIFQKTKQIFNYQKLYKSAISTDNPKILEILFKIFYRLGLNIFLETKPRILESTIYFVCTGNKINILKYLINNHKISTSIKNKLLFFAYINNNYEIFKFLIKSIPDININYIADRSENLLTRSCSDNKFKFAKLLLKSGAIINNNLLLLATKNNNPDLVNYLLKFGCDLEYTNYSGETSLVYSIRLGYFEITKKLLNYGAKLESPDNNLLLYPVNYNNPEILILLVSYININITDNFGWTALHSAIYFQKQINFIQILINLGADINKQTSIGDTPCHLAAKRNNPEIMELLLKYNPNLKLLDNFGNSILHTAIINWDSNMLDLKIIKLLRNIPINQKNSDGDTAFHIACRTNNKQLGLYLLEYFKPDINIKNNCDYLPLHIACIYSLDLTIILLNRTKNLSWDNYYSCFKLVCRYDNPDILEYLIKKLGSKYIQPELFNFPCEYNNSGTIKILIKYIKYNPALELACKSNSYGVVLSLLEAGYKSVRLMQIACEDPDMFMFNILIKNKIPFDSESMHILCRNNQTRILKILFERYSELKNSVYYKNNLGELPIQVACQNNFQELFVFLLNYGKKYDIHKLYKIANKKKYSEIKEIILKYNFNKLKDLIKI